MKRTKMTVVSVLALVILACGSIAAFFLARAWISKARQVTHFASKVADALARSPKRLSDRSGWAPSRFFDDPKVVELCYAMERGDVPEVERLLDEGVDINARGKRGITPLMWWSYPLLQVKIFDIVWKYDDRRVRGTSFEATLSAEDYSAWKRESLQVLDSFKGELKKWLDLGADPRLALSDIVPPPGPSVAIGSLAALPCATWLPGILSASR